MAEQSIRDVVKQPRSVDAPSSTDDSAIKPIDPAVRAAAVNQTSTDRSSDLSDLLHTENPHSEEQQTTSIVGNGSLEDEQGTAVSM